MSAMAALLLLTYTNTTPTHAEFLKYAPTTTPSCPEAWSNHNKDNRRRPAESSRRPRRGGDRNHPRNHDPSATTTPALNNEVDSPKPKSSAGGDTAATDNLHPGLVRSPARRAESRSSMMYYTAYVLLEAVVACLHVLPPVAAHWAREGGDGPDG